MTDQLVADYQPALALLGHEPSGVYHEPWARALMDYYAPNLTGQAQPPFDYRFFNPYQVKLARQTTYLRHRKDDPKDIAAMLDLTLRGLGQPAFLPTGTELLIRQPVLARGSRLHPRPVPADGRPGEPDGSSVRSPLAWRCRQPQALARTGSSARPIPIWIPPPPSSPGQDRQTRPFQRQRLRVLLGHCPNPHDLGAMSDQEILDLFREHMGRAGPALLPVLARGHTADLGR